MDTPLRQLVKKNVHRKALQQIKRVLSEPPVLKFFSPRTRKVTLQCDALEYGLAACLMTDGQPSISVSGAMTDTERKYARD